MRKNFRSDISIRESFYDYDQSGERIQSLVPENVRIEYFTPAYPRARLVCSRNGDTFHNCSLSENGRVLVCNLALSRKSLGVGPLLKIVKNSVADSSFPYNFQNKEHIASTGIDLWGGPSDAGELESESVLSEVILRYGYSAYRLAVLDGFEGTEQEWLESLIGNGIQSVMQTQTSHESDGENIVTVTMTDGTQAQFTIRNGKQGKQGKQGLQGIPGVANAKYKEVDELPTASAETLDFIFLVASETEGLYDMYYTEQDGNTYTWKPFGTTAIQLADYATKNEVSAVRQEVTEKQITLSDDDLRDYSIKTDGTYGTGDSYKHKIVIVTPGEKYRLYAAGSSGARYGFLASLAAPEQGGTIPIVDGTAIVEVTTLTSAVVTIPSGCVALAMYFGQSPYPFKPELYRIYSLPNVGDALKVVEDEVTKIGVKSNIIQTADVELRNAIIDSSGGWTSTIYYRHIILPVSPGMVVNYTANEDANSYYAFLTSDEEPVAYNAAPLLPGTSRNLVEMGTTAKFVIPSGTKFLYLSAGDTRTAERRNLPTTVTLSKTLDTRLAELEEVGTELDETIGERQVDLSVYRSRKGALSDSNTWLNAARYSHILIPVVVGDIVTITASAAFATRYGLLATDEQAVTGEATSEVPGTSRVEVAVNTTVEVTIPKGCNFIYFYGGDGSLGVSHLRENLPATVLIKSSIGAISNILNNDGERISGGIIAANPDGEWLPKMVAAKKRYYSSSITDKPSPVVFAHLSDIHGNWVNVSRFLEFIKHHEGYIDDLLNTGDTASGLFTDGFYAPRMLGDSVAPIMNVVGNHDTRGTNGWQHHVGVDVYNAIIAPYVAGWGVTQPADAAANGYCYYYKDYAAQSLRLVVVDIMGYDSTEDTWLAGVLASTKSSGYHVVIATHFAGGRDGEHQGDNAFNVVECNYSTLQISFGNASGLYGYNPLAYMMTSTVKNFIDGGGKFVGYIQGHYHLDFVAKLVEDPRQLIYAVGSSKIGETRDYNHVGGTRMQDEFQIISIDTYMNTVRLFKVGANIDQFGRLKNSVCVNYESGTVVAQGF